MTFRKSTYSQGASNCIEVADDWRKSSHSNIQGNCVETATGERVLYVGDTTQKHIQDRTVLGFSPRAWEEFTGKLKA